MWCPGFPRTPDLERFSRGEAGHTQGLAHTPAADQDHRGSYIAVWLRAPRRWLLCDFPLVLQLVGLWVGACYSEVLMAASFISRRQEYGNERAAGTEYTGTREQTHGARTLGRRHGTGVRGAHGDLNKCTAFIAQSPAFWALFPPHPHGLPWQITSKSCRCKTLRRKKITGSREHCYFIGTFYFLLLSLLKPLSLFKSRNLKNTNKGEFHTQKR